MKLLKKMKNKFLSKVFFFAISSLFFSLGFLFSLRTWDGKIFVSLNKSQSRGIANVNSVIDIVSLSPDSLKLRSQEVLFQKTKISRSEGGISFQLGSFLIPNKQKEGYGLICDSYSLVELSFVSSGTSLSGHKGRLLVQAPCVNNDEDFIGPFLIPAQKILDHPDMDFFSNEETQTFIRFYETSVRLMKTWHLSTVRFFNSKEEYGFLVEWKLDKNNQNNFFQIQL